MFMIKYFTSNVKFIYEMDSCLRLDGKLEKNKKGQAIEKNIFL